MGSDGFPYELGNGTRVDANVHGSFVTAGGGCCHASAWFFPGILDEWGEKNT